MNSGIYLLGFEGGNTCYVGKSVDIKVRYQQHLDKFQKGTHTKIMQREYDHWGPPKMEVVTPCHPDHIDILEAVYIDHYRHHYGSRLLNTQFPEVPECNRDLVDHEELLQYSTRDHIRTLQHYANRLESCEGERDLARGEVEHYQNSGLMLPEEREDLTYYRAQCENLDCQVGELELEVVELKRYKNLSWWGKLWY